MAMMGSQGTVLTAMVTLLLPAQALAFSAATVLPTPRVTALAPHSQQWRTALPALGRRSFTPRLQEAALPADGGKSNWPAFLPPRKELKKVLPLGLMFFFILFSYTILRDTKDVCYASALATATATVALAAYQPATATAQPTTTAALADQPVGTATDAVATAP